MANSELIKFFVVENLATLVLFFSFLISQNSYISIYIVWPNFCTLTNCKGVFYYTLKKIRAHKERERERGDIDWKCGCSHFVLFVCVCVCVCVCVFEDYGELGACLKTKSSNPCRVSGRGSHLWCLPHDWSSSRWAGCFQLHWEKLAKCGSFSRGGNAPSHHRHHHHTAP